MESWLAKNPGVAGFKRDGKSKFRELALFQDYHGLPSFKKALVDLMAEIRGNKVTFDPNHAGATSANETLMLCLAEQGEAFLLPSPYYPGVDMLFLLSMLVFCNSIMSFVATSSVCTLSIPLKVFSWKSMLALWSLFFYLLSCFLFHDLKTDLWDEKIQINSMKIRLGYLASFCGFCFIFIALFT